MNVNSSEAQGVASASSREGSWNLIPADASAPASPFGLGLSPVDPELLKGSFSCSHCGKQFDRYGDLNEHFRSHSRPFVCPLESCKYHSFGWPNEKDLERHYNGVHSSDSKTFPCLYQPCRYASKRESNCKQHMEKAHGWPYVRDRNAKQECQSRAPVHHSGSPHSVFQHDDGLAKGLVDPLARESIVYPDTSGLSVSVQLDNHISLGPIGEGECETETYVPWASPMSRKIQSQTVLQEFAAEFAAGYRTPITPNCGEDWLNVPIDPRLACVTPPHSTTLPQEANRPLAASIEEPFQSLQRIATTLGGMGLSPQPLSPVPDLSSAGTLTPIVKVEHPSPCDAVGPGDRTQSAGGYAPLLASGEPSGPRKRALSFSGEGGRSSGDDEPPKKRPKRPPHEDDLDDDLLDYRSLPCPFRRAHPDIYDAKNDSRYTTCSTLHGAISSLTRHLGRSAHNFHVTSSRDQGSISSFDVPDNFDQGHPEAGVCKKCWRIFSDRNAFETHIQRDCKGRPRSKSQKYRALLEAFTPIVRRSRTGIAGRQSGSHSSRDAVATGTAASENRPSTRASGVLFGEADVSLRAPTSGHHSENIVRARSHDGLGAELFQRLAMQPPTTATTMPTQQPRGRLEHTLQQSPFIEAAPTFGQFSFSGPGPAAAPTDDSNNRQSIVSGMDSQPIDIGRQAGFVNDAQQILSEMRRDPLTDQAALRRVPMSPYAPVMRAPMMVPQAGPGSRPTGSAVGSGYGGGARTATGAVVDNGQALVQQQQQPVFQDPTNSRLWDTQLQAVEFDEDIYDADFPLEDVGFFPPDLDQQ